MCIGGTALWPSAPVGLGGSFKFTNRKSSPCFGPGKPPTAPSLGPMCSTGKRNCGVVIRFKCPGSGSMEESMTQQKATRTEAKAPAAFQPSFLPGCSFSHGAKLLLAYLRRLRAVSLRQGIQFVWPSQERMAQEIGRSSRQIRRYLDKLHDAGEIRIVRTLRGNRYYFPEQAPNRTKMSDADRTKMSDADRTKMSDADRTKMSDAGEVLKKDLEKDSSSNDAAAAELFPPIELQQAI